MVGQSSAEAAGYLAWAAGLADEAGDEQAAALVKLFRADLLSSVPLGGADGVQAAGNLLAEAEALAGPLATPPLLAWIRLRRAEEAAVSGQAIAAYRLLDPADHAASVPHATQVGLFRRWALTTHTAFRATSPSSLASRTTPPRSWRARCEEWIRQGRCRAARAR
jgi:hypothetical protein